MKTVEHIAQVTMFKLTEREIKCLLLAAQDKSLRDTADSMHVSTITVKKYRSTILKKLGCQTMVGALGMAIKSEALNRLL